MIVRPSFLEASVHHTFRTSVAQHLLSSYQASFRAVMKAQVGWRAGQQGHLLSCLQALLATANPVAPAHSQGWLQWQRRFQTVNRGHVELALPSRRMLCSEQARSSPTPKQVLPTANAIAQGGAVSAARAHNCTPCVPLPQFVRKGSTASQQALRQLARCEYVQVCTPQIWAFVSVTTRPWAHCECRCASAGRH